MSKKPKLPYAERVRRATEAFHVKTATDVTEDEQTRREARQALSTPSPEDVVAYVEDRAGANRVQALRALRSFLKGEPLVTCDLVAVCPEPTTSDVPEDQAIATPEISAKQVLSRLEPEQSPKPVEPYRGPGSNQVTRVVSSGKYLDDDATIRARDRADVNRLK